jgi:hypothetical protein
MHLSRTEARNGFLHLRGGLVVCLYSILDFWYSSEDLFVYLIHMDEPLERSNGYLVRHYLGSTPDLNRRLRQHSYKRKSGGSALLREANKRGITWHLAKVWQANRDFEKLLKRRGHYKELCPICQGIPF